MKLGRPEVSNAAAELADMRAEIEHHEDGTASLRLYLIFGCAELPLDDRLIKVSAREAVLRVVCEGTEIDPSSKFGELVRPNSSKTNVTKEATRKTQSHTGGSLSLEGSATAAGGSASSSASGSVKGSKEAQESSTAVTNTEVEELRVEALGGDRWRIRELNDPRQLHGSYLGKEALCTVRAAGRANRQRIEVTVEIKQRDLLFDPKPDGFVGGLLGSTNREKLTKILMAKSLHGAMISDRSFDGILVASLGECESDEE